MSGCVILASSPSNSDYDSLARCDREIQACLDYLLVGGRDETGAYVGLLDWQREKQLILAKTERGPKCS